MSNEEFAKKMKEKLDVDVNEKKLIIIDDMANAAVEVLTNPIFMLRMATSDKLIAVMTFAAMMMDELFSKKEGEKKE